MGDSEVKDWALLVRATPRPGVLSRITLLCHRCGVDLDFVRFDSERPGAACGLLVLRGPPDVVDRLARKIGNLVDVIAVDVMSLAPSDGTETDALVVNYLADVSTPRDFDDLMDELAQALPAYSQRLTERLRQFRVTAELIDTAPALAREAAHHIERLEAENLLLSRMVARSGGAS